MDDHRWGFEEADGWEYQELDGQAASKAATEPEETLVGAATVVGIPVAIGAILTAAGVSIALITTAILSVQSLTNTISTEQNTIAQKVHDLGTEWAKSNTGAMQEKSDWHVMT